MDCKRVVYRAHCLFDDPCVILVTLKALYYFCSRRNEIILVPDSSKLFKKIVRVLLNIWIFLSIDYIESSRADIQTYRPAFISSRGLL